jgi:hypothetical protein
MSESKKQLDGMCLSALKLYGICRTYWQPICAYAPENILWETVFIYFTTQHTQGQRFFDLTPIAHLQQESDALPRPFARAFSSTWALP